LYPELISKTMNREVLFTEKQRFTQWWIWVIIFMACIIPLWQIYTAIINYQNALSNPSTYIGLITIILLMGLLLSTKLETKIQKDGIYVRFIPFVFKYKVYDWNLIDKVYLRKYNPIGEYGGWGLRGFGKNRAFNISGNQGLQLEFKDGRRLLIGTHMPDEMKDVVKLLGKSGLN